MRISTAQMQARGVAAMLDNQSKLSNTQQQLATGKRILVPSDDVLGSTQVLALNKVIDTHIQFKENANVAESRNQQEDTTLGHSIDVLQRAHELAVQGNNPTLGAKERSFLAVEVRSLLKEMISTANTADSNGEYIFAGFNVDTAPVTETEVPPGSGLFDYAYTGDLGQRNVQIGQTRFVATGNNGQDVFMDVPVSGGGNQNIFETMEQFAIALETNASTATVPDDLKLAMDHLVAFRAQTGARLNAIDNHRALNEDIILQGQKTLSSIEDLDYAEAVSRLNLQLTGLQAAQQSFTRIQNLSLFNFL
ncbi:MAG TPA: flagellar hook-associated protein 3 [Gammaproteobacteria bacterium]|nr:flagellar hook-associated protein 3 [Gammaproteobacteria bacterium]